MDGGRAAPAAAWKRMGKLGCLTVVYCLGVSSGIFSFRRGTYRVRVGFKWM